LPSVTSALAPGLLVAAPPLGDPNFDRAVVLLASHGPEGAFGWVINGRELMPVGELLVRAEVSASAPDIPGVVRNGGPVSQEQVWLMYPSSSAFDGLDGQFEVGPEIMATASRRVLEAIGEGRPAIGVVGLAGYAGWGPGQLEEEIRHGAWLPTDLDAELVFRTPRSQIWENGYARVGLSPIAFVSRTVGSA